MQVQHVMLGPQSCGQLVQASQPRLRCCCKEEQIPTHLAMQMSLLRWQLQQQVNSLESNAHIESRIPPTMHIGVRACVRLRLEVCILGYLLKASTCARQCTISLIKLGCQLPPI